MSQVVSLHLGSAPGLPKPAVDSLDLIAGHGAVGDRHAGLDASRAVLIAGVQSYERLRAAGIALPYGALGENILLDFDPHSELGSRLEIGSAILELVSICPVCRSLSRLDPRLPKLLYRGRGVYAWVIRGCIIHTKDPIRVRQPLRASG
jgi:MOSC domain-containing protein YiiM